MKHTLVLAVDRDDDFGVKGHVISPVIGIEDCLKAANALGVADPEDSDLNAIYAAISTCRELLDDGIDAEVALICGNEHVGYKSDLAVVSQLEAVLDEISPDNVVLIGDGAEDENVYPIVASRAHVDSVRKVYVKQAPNIEGSFYIIKNILSESNKRKRFIAPLGFAMILIAMFFMIPNLMIYATTSETSAISSVSKDAIILVIGMLLLMYAYNFIDRWSNFTDKLKNRIIGKTTRLAMTALALGIIVLGLILTYYELLDTYFNTLFAAGAYGVSVMLWPVVLAIIAFIIGKLLDDYQNDSIMRFSNVFDIVNVASIGLVIQGILDLILGYTMIGYSGSFGAIEILIGIAMTIAFSYTRGHSRPQELL